jgi:hypothetical protein
MDKFVTIAGLVFGGIAAVAAVVAAWFSVKAPDKSDMQAVEKNTKKMSERLEKVESHLASVDRRAADQHTWDVLESKAQRVSIKIDGRGTMTEPVQLNLHVKDPQVVLTSVELLNDAGTVFGSATCSPEEPLRFTAVVDTMTLNGGFAAGIQDGAFNRKRLSLRVNMRIEEREVYREVAVYLFKTQMLYQVEGNS